VLLDDDDARFVPGGDGFVGMGTGDGRAFRPAQVQQQMGHSVIATTMNTYGHVTEGMQREVADKLEVFFRSAFDRE